MFNRYPTALEEKEVPIVSKEIYYSKLTELTKGFGGFDAIVLGNTAKQMNFSIQIVNPDSSDYGYALPNGTLIGG